MNNKIEITEGAQNYIAGLIEKDKSNYFRITVLGGGCAGFQYKFGLVPLEDTFPDDTVIEEDGVKVHVDAISLEYLQNCEIDYEESTFASTFKIRNPDVKTTCGCGESWS